MGDTKIGKGKDNGIEMDGNGGGACRYRRIRYVCKACRTNSVLRDIFAYTLCQYVAVTPAESAKQVNVLRIFTAFNPLTKAGRRSYFRR